MPYDPQAPLESQIHTSIALSLENLRPKDDLASVQESTIDCLVLHSPLDTLQDTLVAWKLLESYVPTKIKALGISNTDLATFKAIYDEVDVKPRVVQNRFYPRTRFDVDIRRFCRERGIVYQSFWTLTGNPELLKSAPVGLLSRDAGVAQEIALYSLVIAVGIVPLNGTTREEHMKGDLEDVVRVKNWTFVYRDKWDGIVEEFRSLIGDP
jgi:diketogulonate reductase-like aldo/keto reductase